LIIDMTLNFDLNEAGVHYFVHHITFFKKFWVINVNGSKLLSYIQ
jgi:hypothetical protein